MLLSFGGSLERPSFKFNGHELYPENLFKMQIHEQAPTFSIFLLMSRNLHFKQIHPGLPVFGIYQYGLCGEVWHEIMSQQD